MTTQTKNIIMALPSAILIVGHLGLNAANREFDIFIHAAQNLSPPRAFIETSSRQGNLIFRSGALKVIQFILKCFTVFVRRSRKLNLNFCDFS